MVVELSLVQSLDLDGSLVEQESFKCAWGKLVSDLDLVLVTVQYVVVLVAEKLFVAEFAVVT